MCRYLSLLAINSFLPLTQQQRNHLSELISSLGPQNFILITVLQYLFTTKHYKNHIKALLLCRVGTQSCFINKAFTWIYCSCIKWCLLYCLQAPNVQKHTTLITIGLWHFIKENLINFIQREVLRWPKKNVKLHSNTNIQLEAESRKLILTHKLCKHYLSIIYARMCVHSIDWMI